jgi:DNA adenine methylase
MPPKTLFEDTEFTLPNVAKVDIYSPFRYPGGKSRWYFYVKQWVLSTRPEVFVEPFAGGAHAGLTVAVEGWAHDIVDEVVLVELDKNVAALWETIFEGDVEWLLRRIQEFEMSYEAAEEAIERSERSLRDKAFAMIVHNRVSRGGVTAPGAGWLKKGENGQGLNSRWYPSTLIDRIETIAEVRDRVKFIRGDAFEVVPQYQNEESALFIDPPYPKAGGRLYEHSDVDHDEVFAQARESNGPVLLTYDDSDEVEGLVDKYDFEAEELVVSTTHHRKKTELLIGDDLSWLRSMSQAGF